MVVDAVVEHDRSSGRPRATAVCRPADCCRARKRSRARAVETIAAAKKRRSRPRCCATRARGAAEQASRSSTALHALTLGVTRAEEQEKAHVDARGRGFAGLALVRSGGRASRACCGARSFRRAARLDHALRRGSRRSAHAESRLRQVLMFHLVLAVVGHQAGRFLCRPPLIAGRTPPPSRDRRCRRRRASRRRPSRPGAVETVVPIRRPALISRSLCTRAPRRPRAPPRGTLQAARRARANLLEEGRSACNRGRAWPSSSRRHSTVASGSASGPLTSVFSKPPRRAVDERVRRPGLGACEAACSSPSRPRGRGAP